MSESELVFDLVNQLVPACRAWLVGDEARWFDLAERVVSFGGLPSPDGYLGLQQCFLWEAALAGLVRPELSELVLATCPFQDSPLP